MGFLQGNLSRDPRLIRLKVKDADLRVPQYVICPPEYVELANVSAFLEITAERPARANNP